MSNKLILDKGNKPFATEEIAMKYIDDKLNCMGEPLEFGDGYAILGTDKVPEAPLKYIKCNIAPRTSENDSEVVDLLVQGRLLQVHRGKDVILPEPFVCVAETAVVEKFELKGSVLLSTGKVSACPIVRVGKSTEAEFKAQIKKGNATRDLEIRQKNAAEKS